MSHMICFVNTKYLHCGGTACSCLVGGLSYVHFAGVIQLVECQLPKLDVVGSSPIARSLEMVGLEEVKSAWRPTVPRRFFRRDPWGAAGVLSNLAVCRKRRAKRYRSASLIRDEYPPVSFGLP